MNRTNTVLMGAVVGVVAAYVSLIFIFTFMNILDGEKLIAFDPFGIIGSTVIPESLSEAYWGLINSYSGLISDSEYITIALFGIGFLWILIGCASPPSRDVRGGDEDPREYLFTSRPNSILKCIMIPWNSLTWMWNLKKVPIILPILFIPFMLPFAIVMDILMIPIFLLLKVIMEIRIRSAASKEKKTYERDTQYAVCPKCKRNFYQPRVKCKCGLIVNYPTPDAHGVSYHTCNKGHNLPCSSKDLGRSKLQSICPYCESEIKTMDAKPIVVSMVGSIGAGKTTLMLSGVEALCATAKGKGIVTEIMTDGISVKAQHQKARATPTAPGELESEHFFMRSRELADKEILINDISGLEFEPIGDKILFEEYYRYNDGIIFVIDPLSVVAIHNSMSPTKGSKTTPLVTLESFYHMFTEINGYGPNVKSTVPLAIVLNKMDDPRTKSAVDAEGTAEKFLIKYGQEAFVKIAKSAFQDVRYFKVASLGDNVNAIEPFKWIIVENDTDLKSKLF